MRAKRQKSNLGDGTVRRLNRTAQNFRKAVLYVKFKRVFERRFGVAALEFVLALAGDEPKSNPVLKKIVQNYAITV